MQKNKADYSTRQTGVLNLIWPYIHTFVQRIVDSGTGVVISDRMTNIHKLAFTNRKLGKKKLLAKDYICPALWFMAHRLLKIAFLSVGLWPKILCCVILRGKFFEWVWNFIITSSSKSLSRDGIRLYFLLSLNWVKATLQCHSANNCTVTLEGMTLAQTEVSVQFHNCLCWMCICCHTFLNLSLLAAFFPILLFSTA